MQPELPWNVAGIPTEAREAARAAARREGLSVGEWMTRRILRGFGDAVTEANGAWRPSFVESAPVDPPEPVHSPRESEEMLARVTRSEAEAQHAYKALDQQLKSVARRLETTERNQTENNRAMTQAATQINIAAREQAQAFEQMTMNVAALAERLARVERHLQNEGAKDAIKALHQGLSRLADQIAQTANQSATQIAALASNVDSLTTQVVEARERSDGAVNAVETHFVSLDERLRVVERTSFSSASALDHTMEHVEHLRAMKDSLEAEIRQQSTLAGEMKETLDHLSVRVSADQSTQQTSIGHIEDSIAKLQAQDTTEPFDTRLKGIEHAVSEIMHRLEYAEHENANTTAKIEQTLHELSAGLDTADHRTRDMINEVQAALLDATTRIAGVEDKASAAHALADAAHATADAASAAAAAAAEKPVASEPEAAPRPAQPILDTPPFAASGPFQESAHDFAPLPQEGLHDFSEIHESSDDLPPPAYDPETMFTPDIQPSAFGDVGAHDSSSGSFIAAARRSANAASRIEQPPPGASMGGFAWTFTGKGAAETEPKQHGKRYALAGSIFGVAVTAALAGMVLSRGVGSPHPLHAPTIAITAASTHQTASVASRGSTGVGNTDDEVASAPAANPSTPSPAPSGVTAAPKPTMTADIAPATSKPAQLANTVVPAAVPAVSVQSSKFENLTALAKSGNSKGQLLLGLKYLEGGGMSVNEAEAARWLARAAQQGEPFAQYRLGTLYERGRGVPSDAKLAAHWYELAAKQGNRKAMHNLAVAFAEGSGEPKDPVQAAMWFARAANLGLADSEFNLAVLYERGMGVKQSLVDAYKWYLIAAAQGDAESKSRAGALSTQLSDADRNAAEQAAASFHPQQPDPAANSIPILG